MIQRCVTARCNGEVAGITVIPVEKKKKKKLFAFGATAISSQQTQIKDYDSEDQEDLDPGKRTTQDKTMIRDALKQYARKHSRWMKSCTNYRTYLKSWCSFTTTILQLGRPKRSGKPVNPWHPANGKLSEMLFRSLDPRNLQNIIIWNFYVKFTCWMTSE